MQRNNILKTTTGTHKTNQTETLSHLPFVVLSIREDC